MPKFSEYLANGDIVDQGEVEGDELLAIEKDGQTFVIRLSDLVWGVPVAQMPMLAGRYYPTWDGAVGSGAVAAADLLFLYPFRIPNHITLKTLFSRVVTGGAGSSVKMGIWANSPTSNRPVGAPLAADNTGQATSSSGTNPEANVADVTLAPGWYWAGTKFTGTLPTMWIGQANNPRSMAIAGSASITALIQTGLSIASTYSDDMPTLAEGASFTMSTVVMPLIGFST